MKSYDGLNSSTGTHAIKVSLQHEEYKGYFIYKIGGNIKGLNILQELNFNLTFKSEKQIAQWKKSGCTIELNDEGNLLVKLTNPENGEICKCECEDTEFIRMIVAVEIINFRVDGDE